MSIIIISLLFIVVLLFVNKDIYMLLFFIIYNFVFSGLVLQSKFLDVSFSRFSEIFLVIFCVITISKRMLYRQQIKLDRLSILFIFIMIYAFISSVYQNDILIILLSMKSKFYLFFLYIALLNSNITYLQLRKVIKFFIRLAYIEVIVSFVQYFFTGVAGDQNAGTFGPFQTNQLSIFQGVIILLLFNHWYLNRLFNLKKVIIILFLSLTVFFGSSIASIVILPLFLFISIILNRINIRSVKYLPIMFVFLIVLFYIGINFYKDNRFSNFRDLSAIQSYSTGIVSGDVVGRLDIPAYTINELVNSNKILNGFGLGSTYSGSDFFDVNTVNQGKKLSYLGRSGFSSVVAELGILGFLLYIYSFYLTYKLPMTSLGNLTDGKIFKLLAIYLFFVNSIYSGIWWTGNANFVMIILIFNNYLLNKNKYCKSES